MWSLARDSGSLDVNSPYFYLTFSQYFSRTSIVAKAGSELAGFIAGLRPPEEPEVLFVWQIGVSKKHRRGGVAHRMLSELLERVAGEGVRYLHASVTPSNVASQRMFRTFAERLAAPCEESILYPSALFPNGLHEEERLLQIGPFAASAAHADQRELAESKRGA